MELLIQLNGQQIVVADDQKGISMKIYKWLITGIAVLFLITAIAVNVSAKSKNPMGSNCVEDGSCCPDKNTCTCE